MITKEQLDMLENAARQNFTNNVRYIAVPTNVGLANYLTIFDLITAARDLEATRKENDILRGIAAKIMPCHYCGVNEIAKCPRGFPGCGLADDIICAEETMAHTIAEQRKELEAIKSWRVSIFNRAVVLEGLVPYGQKAGTLGQVIEQLNKLKLVPSSDSIASTTTTPESKPPDSLPTHAPSCGSDGIEPPSPTTGS